MLPHQLLRHLPCATTATPRLYRSITSIALLHQALPPPVINSSLKPPKPGGYRDACADIAFAVQSLNDPGINIITPKTAPDPVVDEHWSFPDTQPGILAAVGAGANVLWANTSLFAAHPLNTLKLSDVRVIANPPKVVDQIDDKAFTNKLLQYLGFSIPRSWLLEKDDARTVERLSQLIYDLPYPVIIKPVRGRGSCGVELVEGFIAMLDSLDGLFQFHNAILIEEFLEGEECTVTVVPTADGYTALPVVRRFDQVSGVMPWSGTVPVTENSSVVHEHEEDEYHVAVKQECQRVAELLKLTTTCRIDMRKREGGGKFFLFDVNLKPNLTGAGRPNRQDQDSLSTMAAREFGWDYPMFIRKNIETAKPLEQIRQIDPPKGVVGNLKEFTVWKKWKKKESPVEAEE